MCVKQLIKPHLRGSVAAGTAAVCLAASLTGYCAPSATASAAPTASPLVSDVSGKRAPRRHHATFVVFSRHTFRGIAANSSDPVIAPQQVTVGPLSNFTVPTVSYGLDASAQGLAIARDGGAAGLMAARKLAAKELNTRTSRRVGAVRADLSTERTVTTGAYLTEGLKARGMKLARLAGVPTTMNTAVDAVSTSDLASACMPPAELQPLQNASANLPRLQAKGQQLLQLVGRIVGQPGDYPLPPAVISDSGGLPPEYAQLAVLATSIEMTAALGSPIKRIFHSNKTRLGDKAVRLAMDFTGLAATALTPGPTAAALAATPTQYIQQQLARRVNSLVLSHDTQISAIVRALGIVPEVPANPNTLAMYPMETFLFAQSRSRVVVIRMRISVRDDGAMPGVYKPTVAWTGSTTEWDRRVATVEQNAQAFSVGLACRNNLRIEPVTALNLQLFP